MKKILISSFVALFLSTSVFSPLATAAVNAGGKCSGKGQTKISQGMKFTCQKVGKKLKWSKGVKVVQEAGKTSSNGKPKVDNTLLPEYAVIPIAPFYKAITATNVTRIIATSNAPCAKVTDSKSGSKIAFALLQVQVNGAWLDVKSLDSGWEKTQGCKNSGNPEAIYAPWVSALLDSNATLRWKAAGVLMNMPPNGVTESFKAPYVPVWVPGRSFKAIAPTIVNPITWDNLLSRSSEVPSIVFKDVYEVVKRNRAAGNYKVPFDVYRSPNLTQERYVDLDSWLDDLFAFSARLYKPDKEIFLLFPYEDLEWAVKKLSDPKINHPGYERVIREANLDSSQGYRQNTVPFNPQGSYTGIWSLGATLQPSAGIPTIAMAEEAMVNHEYGHQIQQSQWINYDLNAPNAGMSSVAPCWLMEGTPTLLEIALTQTTESGFMSNRAGRNIYLDQPGYEGVGNKKVIEGGTNSLLIDTAFVDAWLKVSSTTMPACTQVAEYGLGYSLGYLGVEALSAIAGSESGYGLFQRLADGQSWNDAFSDIYGITWEKARPILAQYIAENAVNLPR